jgi:hypothetical protein
MASADSPWTLIVETVAAAELATLNATTARRHDLNLVHKRRIKDRKRAKRNRDIRRAESADSPKQAQKSLLLASIRLNSESKIRKKVRADSLKKQESVDSKAKPKMKNNKGHICPTDWMPKQSHYDKAETGGRLMPWVDAQAERMRNWSAANANRAVARKSDWDKAFFNWIADKLETPQNGGGHAEAKDAGNSANGGYDTNGRGPRDDVRRDARPTNHGAIAAGMAGLARKMERGQHRGRGEPGPGASGSDQELVRGGAGVGQGQDR